MDRRGAMPEAGRFRMPSGARKPTYAARFNDIDWGDLYEKRDGYAVELLRRGGRRGAAGRRGVDPRTRHGAPWTRKNLRDPETL